MAAIEPEAVERAAKDSAIWSKYAEEVDRESAREKLAGRLAEAVAANTPTDTPESREPRKPPQPKGKGKREANPVVGYLKSREGRSMINTVARGLFGLLRKRR